MASNGIDGRATAAISIGVLLVWSGIRGWSVMGTLGNLITGRPPDITLQYPLTSGEQTIGEAPAIGEIPSGIQGVATVALRYQGHAYRFGGAPGRDGSKPWDCSSFVNYVVGVVLGRAIPGNKPGQYKGTVHGPPSAMWAIWPGLTRITRSQVAAGDIIVWVGHMGIAIDNTRMISALNPEDRTKITSINAFRGRGKLLTLGRLR